MAKNGGIVVPRITWARGKASKIIGRPTMIAASSEPEIATTAIDTAVYARKMYNRWKDFGVRFVIDMALYLTSSQNKRVVVMTGYWDLPPRPACPPPAPDGVRSRYTAPVPA